MPQSLRRNFEHQAIAKAKINTGEGTVSTTRAAKTVTTVSVPLPTQDRLSLEADGRSFQLIVNLFGAAECGLNVVTNIFRAHDFFELCLMNQVGGLLPRSAQN